jgi:hypothetical protein
MAAVLGEVGVMVANSALAVTARADAKVHDSETALSSKEGLRRNFRALVHWLS